MTQQLDKKQGKKQTRKQPKKISLRYLKNSGAAYLQRFPAATQHFRVVMTCKIDRSCRAHPEQEREACLQLLEEEIIPHFQEMGFLNDTLFAQGLYESLSQRGHPKHVIARKMALKGVGKEDIQNAMEARAEGADWDALLITARKKKCGAFHPDESAEKRHKDMGKLARAGFPYGLIDRFLSLDKDTLDAQISQR